MMGNYRTKLRRAGCTDVLINAGKRASQDPVRSVKRPKRFEITFLPNCPANEDDCSMESKRLQLVEEMKKSHPSSTLISQAHGFHFFLEKKRDCREGASSKRDSQKMAITFHRKTGKL